MDAISAPELVLTEDQQRAKQEIEASIEMRRQHLLTGSAGTGKTTLVQIIAREASARGVDVRLAAPTHKAAGVLRAKLGLPCGTIHSLLSLRPKTDRDKQIFVRGGNAKPVVGTLFILDECFVGSTLVDTPEGPRRIDGLRPGDLIINAIGVDRVVAVRKKTAHGGIKIDVGGQTITASGSHRFFTSRGIVRAENLGPGDQLIAVPEAMRLLHEGVCSQEQLDLTVLLSELRLALVEKPTGVQGEVLHAGTGGENRSRTQAIPGVGRPARGGSETTHRKSESITSSRGPGEDQRQVESHGTQAAGQGRQRQATTGTTEIATRDPGFGMDHGTCGPDETASGRVSELLQDRHRQSGDDDSHRGGWAFSQLIETQGVGCQKGCAPGFIRVENVEVLQPGDPRLDQHRDADGQLYLWDIQAERHASFGVNGVLVHNCSMLGEELMKHIRRWLDGRAVIFVGDPAQIPPVGEDHSESFDVLPASHLTTVVRQAAGNPIIAAAQVIRATQDDPDAPMDWSWCRAERVGDLGVFTPPGGQVDAWMKKAFMSEAFLDDPDFARYLCHTNDRVLQVNTRVRIWKYGDEAKRSPFLPGEMLLMRSPLVIEDTICIATNEEVRVLEIGVGLCRGVTTWNIEVKTDKDETFDICVPRDWNEYQMAYSELRDECKGGEQAWDALHDFTAAFVRAQSIYAMTLHASQGSTFQWAFLDVPNTRARMHDNPLEVRRLLYTGATRAARGLVLVGV